MMTLITYQIVPIVFPVLMFSSIGLLFIGIIVAGASSDSYSDAGIIVGVTMIVLGLAGTITFGTIWGSTSQGHDDAANKNLRQEARSVYQLVLSDEQATSLLQHATITLSDGRRVFLRHVEGNAYQLRKIGPSTPLPAVNS